MKLNGRTLRSTVLVILAAAATSGCGGEGSAAPAFRILFLTSGDAAMAAEARQGLDLAIEELGPDSAGGREIELLIVDDGGDARTAAEVCQNAVRSDSVHAIIGIPVPATLLSCNEVAWRAQVPYIAPLRSSGAVCSENLFFLGVVPNQLADAAVGYLSREGPQRFFLVGSRGSPAISAAIQAVEVAGGTVVGTVSHEAGAPFSSMAGEIAAARPTVVIEMLVGPAQAAFYREVRAGAGPATWATLEMSTETARAIGAPVEGVLIFSDYFPGMQTPGNQRLVAKLQERHGAEARAGPIAAATYDAVRMLIAAADTAGATTGPELIAALSKVKIDGPRGALAFGAGTGFSVANIFVGRLGPGGTVSLISHRPGLEPKGECS